MNMTKQDMLTAQAFINNYVIAACMYRMSKGGTGVATIHIQRGYPLHILNVVKYILQTKYHRNAWVEYTSLKISFN